MLYFRQKSLKGCCICVSQCFRDIWVNWLEVWMGQENHIVSKVMLSHTSSERDSVRWEMLYLPSGLGNLLGEREQPLLLACHWDTLISHLFFIFACTDIWEISREEKWLARRCPPFLGHHISTVGASPHAPTRRWWKSLQTLKNDSALPARRTGFGQLSEGQASVRRVLIHVRAGVGINSHHLF